MDSLHAILVYYRSKAFAIILISLKTCITYFYLSHPKTFYFCLMLAQMIQACPYSVNEMVPLVQYISDHSRYDC